MIIPAISLRSRLPATQLSRLEDFFVNLSRDHLRMSKEVSYLLETEKTRDRVITLAQTNGSLPAALMLEIENDSPKKRALTLGLTDRNVRDMIGDYKFAVYDHATNKISRIEGFSRMDEALEFNLTGIFKGLEPIKDEGLQTEIAQHYALPTDLPNKFSFLVFYKDQLITPS